jgi:hypothetical protein
MEKNAFLHCVERIKIQALCQDHFTRFTLSPSPLLQHKFPRLQTKPAPQMPFKQQDIASVPSIHKDIRLAAEQHKPFMHV